MGYQRFPKTVNEQTSVETVRIPSTLFDRIGQGFGQLVEAANSLLLFEVQVIT
jgi:hypothetical protein